LGLYVEMYKTYFLDHVVVEAFPTMPEKIQHAFHIFALRCKTPSAREPTSLFDYQYINQNMQYMG